MADLKLIMKTLIDKELTNLIFMSLISADNIETIEDVEESEELIDEFDKLLPEIEISDERKKEVRDVINKCKDVLESERKKLTNSSSAKDTDDTSITQQIIEDKPCFSMGKSEIMSIGKDAVERLKNANEVTYSDILEGILKDKTVADCLFLYLNDDDTLDAAKDVREELGFLNKMNEVLPYLEISNKEKEYFKKLIDDSIETTYYVVGCLRL